MTKGLSNIKLSYECITPAKAQAFLDLNKKNRDMKSGVAEKYAADMKQGRWTQCVAPIAFYDNEDLADGQHRLWAVIESGKSQMFVVVRGVPQGAALNIDTGAVRTLIDNAKISGTNTDLSHKILATARAMEGKPSKRPLSYTERIAQVRRHDEAIRWAIANGPHARGIGMGIVWAAIARAWYYEEDKERLDQFGRVLARGFSNGEEDTAGISIRNYLMAMPNANAVPFTELFYKIQNAIWYFMRRRKLTVIKKVEEERYPLKK